MFNELYSELFGEFSDSLRIKLKDANHFLKLISLCMLNWARLFHTFFGFWSAKETNWGLRGLNLETVSKNKSAKVSQSVKMLLQLEFDSIQKQVRQS